MINVLDKGYVRLVDKMGEDCSPLRSARVSTNKDSQEPIMDFKDKRLIQYLLDNGHTSPFESIVMTFEIKAPIFVIRQWHRHRTWSYNELSGRYSELPNEYYIPEDAKVGKQGVLNKQSRQMSDEQDIDAVNEEIGYYIATCESAHQDYEYLLSKEWPRELARAVVPQSIYTKMYATVNLHNLLHFINLRDHDHAQYEIREYARALKSIVAQEFPVIFEAWLKSKQSKYLKGVRQFQEKFGMSYNGPARWIPEMQDFRINFMQEELDEYKEAIKDKDMTKAFDALIDLLFVTVGTAYLQGFPLDEGFDEVLKANMLKRLATSESDSKRGASFDIVKPAGWKAPDSKLQELIAEGGIC